MTTSTRTKMVNGRVSEHAVAQAARVLNRNGLSISAFIRNSLEYVAEFGEVPECGMGKSTQGANADELKAFLAAVESAPMPGKRDFPGLADDALVERLRMERYGY